MHRTVWNARANMGEWTSTQPLVDDQGGLNQLVSSMREALKENHSVLLGTFTVAFRKADGRNIMTDTLVVEAAVLTNENATALDLDGPDLAYASPPSTSRDSLALSPRRGSVETGPCSEASTTTLPQSSDSRSQLSTISSVINIADTMQASTGCSSAHAALMGQNNGTVDVCQSPRFGTTTAELLRSRDEGLQLTTMPAHWAERSPTWPIWDGGQEGAELWDRPDEVANASIHALQLACATSDDTDPAGTETPVPTCEPNVSYESRVESNAAANRVSVAVQSVLRSDYLEYLEAELPRWVSWGLWQHTSDVGCLTVDEHGGYHSLQVAYSTVCLLHTRMGDDAIRSRIALVELHKEYVRAFGTRQSRQRGVGRGEATCIIDQILQRVHRNWGVLSEGQRKGLRAQFHNIKRYGKRWTMLADGLGKGILFLCSPRTAKMVCNTTVTWAHLTSLVESVRYNEECRQVLDSMRLLAEQLYGGKACESFDADHFLGSMRRQMSHHGLDMASIGEA